MSTMIMSLLESMASLIVGEAVVQGSRRSPRDGNPNQQQRQTPQRPLTTLVDSVLDLTNRTLNTALKGLQYLLLLQALLLSAVVLYGVLYWLVMPLRVHDKPLYFDYSNRGGAVATVDFQAGHTQRNPSPLTEVRWLQTRSIKPGQGYKIGVELTLPTSPVNKNIGVFMVYTTLMDDQGNVLATSVRPAVLPHTSNLLEGITMLGFLPLYLLGILEEAETIFIPCIEFYKESTGHPLTTAKVTVSSDQVQIYRASLHITPQLKGLPWLMHDWFYSTFVVGVMFITSLEIITVGFVYLFLFLGPEDDETRSTEEQNRASIRAGASRYSAVNTTSSTARAGGRATVPGIAGAVSDEGLRRRGSGVRSDATVASQSQERPPGVQAYQQGTKYVIGGRGRGGTLTGSSSRQGVGGSERRDDPPAWVGLQEESNLVPNVLDGNVSRDGVRGGLEMQSAVVGRDEAAVINQQGADGLRDSDVAGEEGTESAEEVD